MSTSTGPVQTSESFFQKYGWGGSWYKEPSTTGKFKEMCDKIQKVFEDPENFFEGVTKGVVKGMSGDGGKEGSSTLVDRLTQAALDGGGALSVYALEELLTHSETFDLGPEDTSLKEQALEDLRKAKEESKSLKETTEAVWNRLKKYHIIMGELHLNSKPSSNELMRAAREEMDGKNHDGMSPIDSVVRLQESMSKLRILHNLKQPSLADAPASPHKRTVEKPPSAAEVKKVKELEEKTDGIASSFSKKIVHFTTMYTIHYLFSLEDDPSSFNKILEGEGDFKQQYLERFGSGCRYYFYNMIYEIIRCLIEPIITETIEEVVTRLRTFLRSDVNMLKFMEDKIKEMAEYYGRIELARQNYLAEGRTDEAGTFESYLEQQILLYGGRYTEKDLLTIFNEYLVEFVPRPKIRIFGHHIPLLSSFIEWIVYSVRKTIVRYVLKRTGIVEKLLTEGTNSIQAAQLGMKKLIEQKLTQICEMIDRTRSELDSLSEMKDRLSEKELEARKKELLIRSLDLSIQLHSFKLWRFIEIESCHGDERLLRDLDNPVLGAATDTLTAVSTLLQWKLFSVEKVLEDATTGLMKTCLMAIFEKNDAQTEVHLQTVLEVFNKSFAYVPEEERREAELKYREECGILDENLVALQERLSHTAVATALEMHLKNASGERHNAIKAYVEQERVAFQQFYEEFNGSVMRFIAHSQKPYAGEEETKALREELNKTLYTIENYITYITSHIRSAELKECYSDVQGDLYNIYAATIHSLQDLYKTLDSAAEHINTTRTHEEEIEQSEKCYKILGEVATWDYKGAKEGLNALEAVTPPSIKEGVLGRLIEIRGLYKELEKNDVELKISKEYADLQAREQRVVQKIAGIEKAEEKIKILSILSKQYRDLKINKEFPTADAVELERARIYAEMSWLYQEIIDDPNILIQKYIVPLLKTNRLDKLAQQTFHTPSPKSKAPIFLKLEEVKIWYRKKCDLFTGELKNFEIPPSDLEQLKQQRTMIKELINEHFRQVYSAIEYNFNLKAMDIHSRRENIQVLHRNFYDCTWTFGTIAQQFSVKGCISIGQIKLYKTVAPTLIARVAPRITQGTQAMIGAMEKPFHYKQLILRLILLDIAKRSRGAAR